MTASSSRPLSGLGASNSNGGTHPNCGCPVLKCPYAADYVVAMKDIKLKTSLSDVDSDGCCTVSITVPAKYRSGNEIYFPIALLPGNDARISPSCSSSTSHIDVVGDMECYASELDSCAPHGNSHLAIDDHSPLPLNGNIIRIVPQDHYDSMHMTSMQHPMPPMAAGVTNGGPVVNGSSEMPASAVSVLTEPLPPASYTPNAGTPIMQENFSMSFPVMFGPGTVVSQPGVIGVETPVLRCTAQPLYIPNSRQASTIASQPVANVVGSSTASGSISVLASPNTVSQPSYQQGGEGSPNSNCSRPSPRPHTCYVCNECHPTAASLYTHLETAHNEKLKNLFTCEKCGASFIRRYRYHEHVHAYHTGDGDRQFVCEVAGCGKKYRYRRHLRRHMRVHGDVNEFRRHECDICGKRFPRVSQRDEHRNIHTGEKPFVCEVCGMAYSHSSTLWLHRKRHESGKIDDQGQPIPNAGRDEEHDDVDILNNADDSSWHGDDTATSDDGRQHDEHLRNPTGQSVIVRSVGVLDNSAQVLVTYSESDLMP